MNNYKAEMKEWRKSVHTGFMDKLTVKEFSDYIDWYISTL